MIGKQRDWGALLRFTTIWLSYQPDILGGNYIDMDEILCAADAMRISSLMDGWQHSIEMLLDEVRVLVKLHDNAVVLLEEWNGWVSDVE